MSTKLRRRGKEIRLATPTYSAPRAGQAPERDERQQLLSPLRTPHALRPVPGTRL